MVTKVTVGSVAFTAEQFLKAEVDSSGGDVAVIVHYGGRMLFMHTAHQDAIQYAKAFVTGYIAGQKDMWHEEQLNETY